MKLPYLPAFLTLLVFTSQSLAQQPTKPLRALLIAGGCCHDYQGQHRVLFEGIQARANVQVDVYWTDDGSTNPPFPLFERDDWATGYDVIIHDECAADQKDLAIVQRILAVHEHIPAVHLHCAMHSFRTGTDLWFKHLGLASTSHGPQLPIELQFVDQQHPICQGLTNWTTDNEELYNNTQIFNAHALVRGKQKVSSGDQIIEQDFIVAWTNEGQGARSFSTTIGHNTTTVADPRYLDLVTRGLLWACDKLTPEYQQPFQGENTVAFVKADEQPRPQIEQLGVMPDNATLVKPSASSVQSENKIIYAFDGDPKTRWCADGDSYPQWLMWEFAEPRTIESVKIVWERNRAYQYRIEGSADGKTWTTLVDASSNRQPSPSLDRVAEPTQVKWMRITGLGNDHGGWCSIWEVSVDGDGIESLWPANEEGKPFAPQPTTADPFQARGNLTPRLEPYSPKQEAEILRDVQVPDGFEATVFAAPPAVNYPVFVAAAPDGTLYVSSDGNGSLGRDPERGRVIRLRDRDGDGRADETKVFCEVDAPRGLVWDHDRLYLMHPPHLSAFIDHDGDGVSDEQQILVKNLAFGYDKRPADHTTNGLSLGVDGWLYIAGGDFGFIDAEGTDGRKLTHRGGGVIRVRPDGTGLEIYSTGTRNILEVAISPRMELFARDNTNDGGGWDVRLHHFTGGDDHGYPRLYKNFADEAIAPLADYGGGSGCGAVYIDEPGFGEWNDAPFTADWGTGALYHHSVRPRGATFEEFAAPQPFIRMTRPTDADVDGMSRVYCASWRGATFNWAGPDVGYIVCVKPKDFQPEPLPQFLRLSDDELVAQLNSASYRRRLEAQRELLRRDNKASENLLTAMKQSRSEARNFAEYLQSHATTEDLLEALSHPDPVVVHIAVRQLALRVTNGDISVVDKCLQQLNPQSTGETSGRHNLLRALAMMHTPETVQGLRKALGNCKDAEQRFEILAALCRLHFQEGQWKGDSWGTRPDTRGPYYQPEAWSETPTIASILRQELAESDPVLASKLIQEMSRNRIQSSEALDRLIQLALKDSGYEAQAIAQLAQADDITDNGQKLLIRAANHATATSSTLKDCVIALARSNRPTAVLPALEAIAQLADRENASAEFEASKDFLFRSRFLQNQISVLASESTQTQPAIALWVDAALLAVADNDKSSPEARALASQAIATSLESAPGRTRLIEAASRTDNHFLDELILQMINDSDVAVATAAQNASQHLKLDRMQNDTSPKIAELSREAAIRVAVAMQGDLQRGQRLFKQANCVNCHTVTKDVKQQGPFLGNIAATYKRPQLAEAILLPNKTIAQGFATTAILTVDGQLITGFVTDESAQQVTLRDAMAKEYVLSKEDIESRKNLTTSVMPEGVLDSFTVRDLASILDYLQSLNQ